MWRGWKGGTQKRAGGTAKLVMSIWGKRSSWWHGQAGEKWLGRASFNRGTGAGLHALGHLRPQLLPSWVIAEHRSPNPLCCSKLLRCLGSPMLKGSCMKEYFPFVNRRSDLLSIDPVRLGFKFNLFPSYP